MSASVVVQWYEPECEARLFTSKFTMTIEGAGGELVRRDIRGILLVGGYRIRKWVKTDWGYESACVKIW